MVAVIEHRTDECQCEGKWCPQCQQKRCRLNFTKDKKRSDKLDAWCRFCNNARRAAYRKANPEKARQLQEISYRKNLPHYRAYQQTYRDANGDVITAKIREAKYYRSEHSKASRNRYRRTKWKDQRSVENANRRARKRKATGSYTVAEWRTLKSHYDYTCLCCGRREPEIKLTVDHVVPLLLGGTNSIENIQPLCLSCNSSKQAKIIDYRKKVC